MKIVFIGIQGSGKGTQARILEENYGFKLYETGGALREIAAKDTDLGRLVKSTIEAGHQVSPEIVEDILADVVASNPDKNLILDGFVRNQGNKDSMDKIVGDYKVVFFNLDEESAKKRLLGRMYDPQTGETFPSDVSVNPKNGNALVKRSDDEETAINQRIQLFFEKTLPIVEIYRQQGNLIEINAKGTIEEVTENIRVGLGL